MQPGFTINPQGCMSTARANPRERNHYRQTHSIPFGQPSEPKERHVYDKPATTETAGADGPNGTSDSPGEVLTRSGFNGNLHAYEYAIIVALPLWRVWGFVALPPCDPEVPFCIPPLAKQRLPFRFSLPWRVLDSLFRQNGMEGGVLMGPGLTINPQGRTAAKEQRAQPHGHAHHS